MNICFMNSKASEFIELLAAGVKHYKELYGKNINLIKIVLYNFKTLHKGGFLFLLKF